MFERKLAALEFYSDNLNYLGNKIIKILFKIIEIIENILLNFIKMKKNLEILLVGLKTKKLDFTKLKKELIWRKLMTMLFGKMPINEYL